ncbi:MAG: BrnT family toxin [Deltaproteobacteria bacterium]|nr:BrnT family toxin [Deltaproteobacteria bacterium]
MIAEPTSATTPSPTSEYWMSAMVRRWSLNGTRRTHQHNLRKHGVAFETATRVFDDPRLVLSADVAHSHSEQR